MLYNRSINYHQKFQNRGRRGITRVHPCHRRVYHCEYAKMTSLVLGYIKISLLISMILTLLLHDERRLQLVSVFHCSTISLVVRITSFFFFFLLHKQLQSRGEGRGRNYNNNCNFFFLFIYYSYSSCFFSLLRAIDFLGFLQRFNRIVICFNANGKFLESSSILDRFIVSKLA